MSPATKGMLARCAPGTLLQATAPLGPLLAPGPLELGLLYALIAALLGTLLNALVMERHARRAGLPDRWALAALLGPLGPLLLTRHGSWPPGHPAAPGPAPASSKGAARNKRPDDEGVEAPRRGAKGDGTGRTQPESPPAGGGSAPRRGGYCEQRPRRGPVDRLAGALLTALIAAGFAAAAWLGLQGHVAPPPGAHQAKNELQAYRNLGRIAEAQERYRRQDWDGDGAKTYAAFYIHLWRSVRPDGTPVPVDLISRELGFATTAAFALHGYTYEDLATAEPLALLRPGAGPAAKGPLDPARQWAVAARPRVPGSTGRLPFIAHSAGEIWTLPPRQAGRAPGAIRWIQVRSEAHLSQLQRQLSDRAQE